MGWLIELILSLGLAGVLIYIGFRLGLFYSREQTDEQTENLKRMIRTVQKSADEQDQRLANITKEINEQKDQLLTRINDLSFLVELEENQVKYVGALYNRLMAELLEFCVNTRGADSIDVLKENISDLLVYVKVIQKEFNETKESHQEVIGMFEIPKRSDEE